MKTIVVTRGNDSVGSLVNFIGKVTKYADHIMQEPVICTRLMGTDNYNTTLGEIKDAVSLDDFDVFIVGVTDPNIDPHVIQALNKAHTYVCTTEEYDSAKNFLVMI